jgi:flagellar protein FliL
MAEVSEAVATDAPAPKSGGRNKLILIIVAVVLLLGAAGGGFFFLAGSHAEDEEQVDDGDATDEADAEAKDTKGAKAKKDKKSKKSKKPAAPAIYVKLDPALVVNFESEGVTRFLQVAVEIATRDPLVAEELKLHEPVIRNDLLLLLANQQRATISTREGKEQLRSQALEAVRKVLDNEGSDGKKVEALYFTSFVMQ